ncbi:VOC family protein [Actinocorallia longicatena]|uniref:VOC family protein n=1 Tax=Actinocorallia longicatena TaxID=111803 RepID=A0ABP6QM41_9ACTN
MPLGHLGVNVSDLDGAREYYAALMPLVGYEPFVEGPDQFSYRPAGGKHGTYLFFYPALERGEYSRHEPGLQHLAFMVKSRADVHRVHAWAVARGDDVVHQPREFAEYHEGYFAVFWTGPDGFMLEAVCHRDEP